MENRCALGFRGCLLFTSQLLFSSHFRQLLIGSGRYDTGQYKNSGKKGFYSFSQFEVGFQMERGGVGRRGCPNSLSPLPKKGGSQCILRRRRIVVTMSPVARSAHVAGSGTAVTERIPVVSLN